MVYAIVRRHLSGCSSKRFHFSIKTKPISAADDSEVWRPLEQPISVEGVAPSHPVGTELLPAEDFSRCRAADQSSRVVQSHLPAMAFSNFLN
jgi:hypothetical protein